MPNILHQTPIGVARIREEDGFITSVKVMDHCDEEQTTTPLLKMAAQQLDEYFTGERQVFDLPIKQPGSSFQQEVWQCLLKIGYGKTISYLRNQK